MQSCVEDGAVGTALNEMLTSLIKGLETFPLDDDLVNCTSAAETMGECVKASQRRNNKSSIHGDSMRDEPDKFSNEIDDEDKVHLSMRTYLSYFKAGGGYVFSCFMIMLFLLTQVPGYICRTVGCVDDLILLICLTNPFMVCWNFHFCISYRAIW